MKDFLSIVLLFAVSVCYGQTASRNYVKETTRRTASVNTGGGFALATPANTHISTTTYYDGLGRPIQIVDQNSSPTDNQNIVTHIEYEKNIGQTKEFLPFLSTGYITTTSGLPPRVSINTTYNSDYVENAQAQTLSFYETYNEWTPNPYAENRKEASPRQRILETGFPGEPWAATMPLFYKEADWSESDWEIGHAEEIRNTIRNSYVLNNANEVKRYVVTTTFSDGIYKNSITANGNYPANTLTKTVVKNENWKFNDGKNNTTEEFKDPSGNIVLKRTYNAGISHDTYYVYNHLDLLVFVVPPMANGSVAVADLTKWCYQYNYDAKKRLVEKKLPQKDWEYIVYDKSDRVVMTGPVYSPFGDGTKGWLLTKYEPFGRLAYTGYYAASTFTSASRNTLAQNIFAVETRTASNNTIDGIAVRYTNTTFPRSFKLLTVNYYDDYSYPNATTAFPTIENQTVNTAVKGQPTGTWTRTLTTASSTAGMLSYDLYDDKYRVIRSYSQNHLGGYMQVDSKLSFTGVPTKTITTQKQNSSAAVLTITDNFTYDRRDRLTKQTQQIGSGTIETIVANTYDELGVLVTKNVGGATGSLQKVDYKYNIRGWLTDINNAEMDFVDGENDLFQFKINYNRYGMVNPNLFNGNINSVWSRTKVDNSFKGYVYWYDHLNRLIQAKNMYYHKPGGWFMGQYMDDSYEEAVTYDKNGNIITMYRTGELLDEQQALPIDDLTYTYNGNQLQTVTDTTNNTDGFKDGNAVGNDYVYDTFGNITQDKNKKITNIKYNHLNLPVEVVFNTGKINYIYDAAGTRLTKKVQPIGGMLVINDYINSFQYENGVLQFFLHPEGYVKSKANDQFMYAYQYKDHLGNVRLSYADVNGNEIIEPSAEILEENNYYPFGLKHKGYNEIVNSNRSEAAESYKFNGMEWQSELGLNLYDFGARNYDASIGRWLNVDPLAEEMRRFSPYVYAFNNPVYFIDPDGMKPDDWYIDWNSGRVLGQDGAKTNNIRIIKGSSWGAIKNAEGGTMTQSATDRLHAESNIVKINNSKIHTDLNTINNETISDQTKERQAFFMLNRSEDSEGFPSAELSTTIGKVGQNGSADIPNVNGFNNDQLMVGQAHTHNLDQTGRINLPGTSDADYNISKSRGFNIYAIDSYQGSQDGGNAIHMTNSNNSNGINVGTTNDTGAIGSQVLDDFIKFNKPN